MTAVKYVTYEEFEQTVNDINKNFEHIDFQLREVGKELGMLRRDATLGFENCNKRFDAMDKKIDYNYKALDKKIDDGYKALDKKIDDGYKALDKKIDDGYKALDKKIDQLQLLILERLPKPDFS